MGSGSWVEETTRAREAWGSVPVGTGRSRSALTVSGPVCALDVGKSSRENPALAGGTPKNTILRSKSGKCLAPNVEDDTTYVICQ